MLRLISIIGITLAMVVGFVALSRQMRDDYDVRSRVITGIGDMKTVAMQELTCDRFDPEKNAESPGTFEQTPDDQANDKTTTSESSATTLESDDPQSVFASMSYEDIDESTVEVVGMFRDIAGGSGKLRIKSGRQLVIRCSCDGTDLACQITASDINKKYLPGKLGK